MSDFILSCCSTADLDALHFERRNITYICFHYELGGVQYTDDLGKTMSMHDFYEKMAEGADTKTSQINVDEFISYFEPMLEAGHDVLHLTLSSGISGVVNSANIARDELSAKYPDRKIYVVDSLAASAGYGLLMDMLADYRDEGHSVDETRDYAESIKNNINHWFFTTTLKYFVRGGRVSKTAGFVGNMLNICPLLNVNIEGKLIPREKIRTKKKVIKELVDKMILHARDGKDYNGKCYISHSDCYDDAKAVADLIEENFPNLKGKVEIYYIGTTIGAHTGPGTVALFFEGDQKEE